MAPKDGVDPSTAPANRLYSYNLRVYGVDCVLREETPGEKNLYHVGDAVWVKPPGNRCDTRFTRGTVSEVKSDVAVVVDGMPRHIRDLRRRVEHLSDDDDLMVNASVPPSQPDDGSDLDSGSSAEEATTSLPSQPLLRRSLRLRRSPNRYSP